MRTLIDILRKGNQELFHTSIISWLLNPNAEHGLADQFLKGFSALLTRKGCPSLSDEIRQGKPIIRSEATSYKRRYDIEIQTENSLYVIENKTKTIGGLPQFKQYEGDNIHLIALGLCEVSFSPDVIQSYPFITYADILDLLDEINADNENDFSVLVRHYRDYIRRELQLLDWINEYYSKGKIPEYDEILETISSVGGYTKNDERFLNLYYLENLKKKICGISVFENSKWVVDKNMMSGVWLANYEELPKKYNLHQSIRDLCERMDGNLWFHIEMWDGVLTKAPTDVAGMLQLRCSTSQSNSEFHKNLKNLVPLQEDEYYPSRIKENAGTFYGVGRSVIKEDLVFQNMVDIMRNFMKRFGVFDEQ